MVTNSEESPAAASADVERLRQIVRDAWDATDSVEQVVGQEAREAAFKLVLETMLHAAPSRQEEFAADDANGAAAQRSATAAPIDASLATLEQRTDAVSRYLSIGYDEVGDLYDLSGDEPLLIVNAAALPKSRAEATRALTLLVAASRSALGLDTGTSHVRAAVDLYQRLDPANFGKTLAAMSEISLRGLPRSHNRLVRLNGKGVDAARALAARYVNACATPQNRWRSIRRA